MAFIKFTNNEKLYTVTLSNYPSPADRKRMKLCFLSEKEAKEVSVESGFVELNEHNHVNQSDFSNMNYVYRKFDDNKSFILSNMEGDVYTEPVPTPEPEPYVPTLEEVIQSKISELSLTCNNMICNGVSVEMNGTQEHFSYTENDQTNIKELFNLALITNAPMYYHANNQSCKLYTAAQIINLYLEATMNKMHHTTYFNQLRAYVHSLKDIEAVTAVTYGVPLTGEYLTTYEAAIKQAQAGMETLLKKGSTIV